MSRLVIIYYKIVDAEELFIKFGLIRFNIFQERILSQVDFLHGGQTHYVVVFNRFYTIVRN